MSLTTVLGAITGTSFPRVSGDEPTSHGSARRKPSFSPRERG